MQIPRDMGVMILPETTLFPQALLPLFIFEPRYQQMLEEALASHRLMAVAMLRPASPCESPVGVAGLGLIRVAVKNRDGTSTLILQGLTRVELGRAVRYKPYRIHRIRPLRAAACDNLAIDALLAKLRELVEERVQLGVESGALPPVLLPPKVVASFLRNVENADQAADLVSGMLLSHPRDRQAVLETVELAPRLRRLIHFLMAEIRQSRKSKPDERS
jgi:Lon protease-like protein